MYQDIDGNPVSADSIRQAITEGRARIVHQRALNHTATNGLILDGRDWDTRGQCYSMSEETWTRMPISAKEALNAAYIGNPL